MTTRIAHVVATDAFAGVERYICDTVGELSARGVDVTVIGGDPAAMRTHLPAGVLHLPAAPPVAVARALWISGPYDLVHTHMTAAEAAVAPLKGRRFERWVTTRHFAQARGSSALGRLARPAIERGLDLEIAISVFVGDAVGGDARILPNGVPHSTLPPQDRGRTVAMLQRLETEKDTALGLRAWALAGLDGWALQVYGRGAQEPALRRLAHDLGIDDTVTFEGFTHDPRGVMARAGLVLATAPAEPFGLSVVEAMAEGAPVLAARGGAHTETLGADGAYFAPGDAGDAADQLRRMTADPARRMAYGAQLRDRHQALFTVEAHVDGLEALYAEVLG